MAVADAAGTRRTPTRLSPITPRSPGTSCTSAASLAGSVSYHLRGQQITLIHTEVNPRFQGAGLATHLARYSLDDARKRNLAVLPSCPYIRSWIRKHPEYADLVPDGRRAEFGL